MDFPGSVLTLGLIEKRFSIFFFFLVGEEGRWLKKSLDSESAV